MSSWVSTLPESDRGAPRWLALHDAGYIKRPRSQLEELLFRSRVSSLPLGDPAQDALLGERQKTVQLLQVRYLFRRETPWQPNLFRS